MRRHLLAAAVAVLFLAPAAVAQAEPDTFPLAAGAKIRLTTEAGADPFFTTRLLGIDRDTLLVQARDGGVHVVALSDVTRLDVSRGGGRQGRVIGGTLGAVLLMLPTTGLVMGMDEEPSGTRRALGIGGAGLVGALLGGWVGGSLSEHWEPLIPREEPRGR